jgi:hypothetical protein
MPQDFQCRGACFSKKRGHAGSAAQKLTSYSLHDLSPGATILYQLGLSLASGGL